MSLLCSFQLMGDKHSNNVSMSCKATPKTDIKDISMSCQFREGGVQRALVISLLGCAFGPKIHIICSHCVLALPGHWCLGMGSSLSDSTTTSRSTAWSRELEALGPGTGMDW